MMKNNGTELRPSTENYKDSDAKETICHAKGLHSKQQDSRKLNLVMHATTQADFLNENVEDDFIRQQNYVS